MSIICTEDGNWLAFVPGIGAISGRTRDEVIREIERRKARAA